MKPLLLPLTLVVLLMTPAFAQAEPAAHPMPPSAARAGVAPVSLRCSDDEARPGRYGWAVRRLLTAGSGVTVGGMLLFALLTRRRLP